MATAGRATATGTARFAARHLAPRPASQEGDAGQAGVNEGFFRPALGLTLSSIGWGTNLGEPTDAVDRCCQLALAEAVRSGCNVLDTAISYRGQRSEVVLGQTVTGLVASGQCGRDELVISSKGGFVPYPSPRPANLVQYIYDHFVATGMAEPDDFAGGIHCMAPNFLSQQIAWSLRNTGLRTLDIYCIQNPEAQLPFVDGETFRKRLQLAFARLEEEVSAGRIGVYGVATWEGLRRPPMSAGYMSLEIMLRLASEVAGTNHHLCVVQLPVNAAMPEAATFRNQPVKERALPVLRAASELGLTVIASAALGQGQIPARASTGLDGTFPELRSPAQRAVQFVRSLPGVTTALVGSTRPEHVQEDLAVSAHPPAPERALRLAHLLSR